MRRPNDFTESRERLRTLTKAISLSIAQGGGNIVARIFNVWAQRLAVPASLIAMLCVLLAAGPAAARPWNPKPAALAQDYAMIMDTRGAGDLVLVFWFVPPIAANSPQAQAVLDKYVIIGVVHGHMQIGGSMSFDAIDALQAQDSSGKSLTALTGDKVPPEVAGFMTTMGGFVKQSIGAMGQGMHFFAFDGGNVHACGKGQLAIPYDGQTYTYDTPIPGCSTP